MSLPSLRGSSANASDPIETASLDELRALQLARLKLALAHAATIPHYRKKFSAAGVAPGDLKNLAVQNFFPFTNKDDLQKTSPFGLSAVPLRDVVRIHASGGTPGRPTVVGYTRRDLELWSALMARSIRAGGG